MQILVTILHVMVCIFLMLTVLLQAGKGGGMGAAFGGGSSMGTVFGGSGAGNFLRRLTVAAAVIFLFTSMILAWMATPSTDPLKKYFAGRHAANEQRTQAHKDALKGGPDETKPAGATPASNKPAADKPAAATDKPAAATDKPAADKPAAATDKPAAATDKPAADKSDKPAEKSGSTP